MIRTRLVYGYMFCRLTRLLACKLSFSGVTLQSTMEWASLFGPPKEFLTRRSTTNEVAQPAYIQRHFAFAAAYMSLLFRDNALLAVSRGKRVQAWVNSNNLDIAHAGPDELLFPRTVRLSTT